MPYTAAQVLHAANAAPPPAVQRPSLVVAGAAGALGTELLSRLAGAQRYNPVQVLVGEPFAVGLREVHAVQMPQGLNPSHAPASAWNTAPLPALRADVGLVVFDTPRMYYNRERALWMPAPEQLLPLARWFCACGVRTLVVVLPHAPGRLPEAVKRGLATLDEQAVAALGFERLLLVRSAQKAQAGPASANLFEKTAAWMLSVFGYMVPQSEQPVRPGKVAEFVTTALPLLPPGIHIAAPETVWQAMQGDVGRVVRSWLQRD